MLVRTTLIITNVVEMAVLIKVKVVLKYYLRILCDVYFRSPKNERDVRHKTFMGRIKVH